MKEIRKRSLKFKIYCIILQNERHQKATKCLWPWWLVVSAVAQENINACVRDLCRDVLSCRTSGDLPDTVCTAQES